MTDRTVRVRLEAMIGQYEAAMAKAGLSTKNLGHTIESVRGRSEQSFLKLGSSLGGIGTGAIAGGAGVAIAGIALVKMAKDGVESYVHLVDEVKTYKNVTGASAEESSKMVAVARVLGVQVDTVANGMFRLSRQVVANKDALAVDGVIVARNAKGQVDLSETLTSVAGAYQRAGAGAAGNKVLFDAFGRAGRSMIPILKQSREQLEEFWKAAERHGEIVSDSDLKAVFEYKVAVRELGEAWEGLQRKSAPTVIKGLTMAANFAETEIDGAIKLGHAVGWATDQGSKLDKIARDLIESHGGAAEAAISQSEAEQAAADALEDEAKKTAEFKNALAVLYTSTFAVADTQDKFTKDLADFADTVRAAQLEGDRYATTLDGVTSSGINNQQMVRGLVKDILDTATAAEAAGTSIQDATAVQRVQLAAVLEQLGFNKVEAEKYTAALTGIPETVSTDALLNIDPAMAALNIYLAELAKIPNLIQSIASSAEEHDVTRLRNQRDVTNPSPAGAVADAAGGEGPKTSAVRDQQAKDAEAAARSAKASAEDAARAAAEAERKADEHEKAMFEHGLIPLDKYQAYLDGRMAQETKYSDDWFALLDERERVTKQHAEDVKAWNEALAENERKATERQQTEEDNQHKNGRISNQKYRKILQERFAILAKLYGYWSDQAQAVYDQIIALDDAVAQLEQDALDKVKEAAEKAAQARDDAFDKLNDLLDKEADIRQKLADSVAKHNKEMADVESRYAADQAQILDERKKTLLEWADVNERVQVRWGNSVSALVRNLRQQLLAFDEWTRQLAAARGRGVSEAVIKLLGLDQGPEALGQLRMIATATQAEIDDLNNAVTAKQAQAGAEVADEATKSFTDVGDQLKKLAETHAAEIEQLTEDFLADQRELTDELATLGEDQGRSYGDAIAAGLQSAIPGIRIAAQAAADALTATTTPSSPVTATTGGGVGSVHTPSGHGHGGSWGVPAGRYDSGGYLPEGWSLAWNGTGSPEPVGRQQVNVTPQFTINVYDANGVLVTDDRIRVVVRDGRGQAATRSSIAGRR